MNLKTSDIKKLSVDPTVVDLVASLLVLQAKAELTREKVDAYIHPLFDEFEFYLAEKWAGKFSDDDTIADDGRILDRESLFLTDLDGETYKAYCKACRDAHLANDFADVVLEHEAKHGGDRGWCPALIAESEHRDARNRLADHVAKHWLGLDGIHYPHSKKLAEIITGCVLNGPAGKSLDRPGALV